jgi:hypothetical protein
VPGFSIGRDAPSGAFPWRVWRFTISGEEFARAVAATDLPHDFTLDDLHWPMPGMVIAWPADFMRETVGRDICYVYAASMDAGDHSVATMPVFGDNFVSHWNRITETRTQRHDCTQCLPQVLCRFRHCCVYGNGGGLLQVC